MSGRHQRFIVENRHGELAALCKSATQARRLRSLFDGDSSDRCFDGPHTAYRESWRERETADGTSLTHFKRVAL